MNYSLRKSTKNRTKASVERKKVLEENKKAKNTSILIGKLRSQEEKAYIDGVLEQAKFTAKVYRLDSSSSDEDLDSSKGATSSHQELGVVTNDKSGEPSDLHWDHFGDIESPEKPENYSPIFPDLSQIEPAVWSSKVNKFFPPNCISTPLPGDKEEPFTSGNERSICSPRLNLLDVI